MGGPPVRPWVYAQCTYWVSAQYTCWGRSRFSSLYSPEYLLDRHVPHQAHATRPDEPEQRVLPAPATVFVIVTPDHFVRIAAAPTGIPSPVYWARSYVLSPIRVSRVPVPESTDNMPNDTDDGLRNTWQPRPPPAYARPLSTLRSPGLPLAAEASETHIIRAG